MVEETLNKFDVVKEGSYLLYDFKDIVEEDAKVPSTLEGDENGEKEVDILETSPLFHLDTINNEADAKFLEAITSKVPYYHSQTTEVGDDADAVLNMSDARDPSINDVHSALQDDPFWKEWFTSVWGKEQNKLLLEAYNRLQFPYINENQYLNAAKFADIAKESSEGEASQVEFDENNHLNDIVEERLQAIYSLMNYAQLNPQFLNDWAESLWRSGVCTKEEAEREKAIFKLQDVKNEVLRRKFAGSSSLYKMILNSINRQGTLAKTTLLAEEDGVTNWQNGRPVRDLNFRRGGLDVTPYVELVTPEDGMWGSIPGKKKAIWKCDYNGEDVFFESDVEVAGLEKETAETENGSATLESDFVAPNALVESVVGKTVVWNQLENGSGFYTVGDTTISAISDGYRASTTSTYIQINSGRNKTFTKGNVYLASFKIATSSLDMSRNHQLIVYDGSAYQRVYFTPVTGNNSIAFTPNDTYVDKGIQYQFSVVTGGGSIDLTEISVVNMTTLFGVTETSQVTEQMKAWVRAYAEAHPQYDGGSLVNSMTEEVKFQSKNIWDGAYEKGAFLTSGGIASQYKSFYSKNYIDVRGLETVTFFGLGKYYSLGSYGFTVAFYDQDKNFIKVYDFYSATVAIMDNASYIRFNASKDNRVGDVYSAYKGDVGVVAGSQTGVTYTPYMTSTLTIPSSWYSVPDLGIEGTVIDLVEKKVTWTYGKVDLGSLTDWAASSTTNNSSNGYRWISYGISGSIKHGDNSYVANAMCASYKIVSANDTYFAREGLDVGSEGAIHIFDSRYTTNSSKSDFINAINGVELLYELVTPITKTFEELGMEPIDPKLRIEGGGTITVVSTGAQSDATISYYPYPEGARIPEETIIEHEGEAYPSPSEKDPKTIKITGEWADQYINSYVDFNDLSFIIDPYAETPSRIDAITAIHKNAEVPLDLTLPMFYESTATEDIESLENIKDHLRTEANTVIDFDMLEGNQMSTGIPSNTVLDIQADHILYHENSVQKKLGAAYDYPTKNGTSISLMDSTWMDYVEDIIEDRQRPSEEIRAGVQISLVAESASLKLFSMSGSELLYGDETVTELTTTTKPSIFADDTITGSTYYQGTLPFEDEGCYWREGHYDSERPTVNVLQYFDNTNEVWSDFIDPNESEAAEDANHILAEMKISKRKNYKCTVEEDELDTSRETTVLAYNSKMSTDTEKIGVKVDLDESEITDLSDKTILCSSEEYEGGTAINAILSDDAVKIKHFNSNPTSNKDGDELTLTAHLPHAANSSTWGKYEATIEPKLQLGSSVAFADSLRIGTNLKRNIEDGKAKVRHNANSRKLASDNYIVLPFAAGPNNLSKLNMKDNTLSFIFNILTSADSYYTEMRYPIPTFLGNTTRIANKWTGIRTLKEGSYFITCKYPALITPFTEEDLNQKKSIPVVFASRFKITVESELRELLAKDADELDPTLNDYTYNNFENQIYSYNSEDNKTFPHRIMKIRLYVQDQVSNNMTWTLIGSNIESEAVGDVLLLDKSSTSLIPRKAIPAFIVPSYTSGFYTENEGTVAPNLSSVELENNESYRLILDYTANVTELSFIEGVYSTVAEEVPEYSKSVDLLDGDALVKEYIYSNATAPWSYDNSTMYLVRAGFNTKAIDGEVQWAENTGLSLAFQEYTKPEGIYFDTANNRFTSLNGTVINNIYDISSWTEATGFPGNATLLTPSAFNSSEVYYRIAETADHLQYWQGVTNFAPVATGLYYKSGDDFILIADDRRLDRTTTYYTGALDSWTLGDPYSESSSKNDLLASFYPIYGRNSINDCPFIPYIYLGYHVKDFSVTRGGFRKTTKTLGQTIKKGELAYAQEIYNGIRSRVRNAITNLTASPSGVFDSLGSIEIQGTPTLSDYQLLTRTAEERVFPIVELGNRVICDELYGNNLIQDQEFNNVNNWTVSRVGLYEPDNTWKTGKDVYTIEVSTIDPITMTYYFTSPVDIGATEKAISVKNAKVGTFNGDTFIEWNSANAPGEGWLTYSKQDDSCLSEDRSSITFTLIPNGYDEDENLLPVCVTKAVCRINHETTWTPGLSNVIFNRGTSALRVPSFVYMTLKTAGSYYPLLLKSKDLGSGTSASNPATEIVTYLSGYKKYDKAGYSYYVEPWKRKIERSFVTSELKVYSMSAINGKEHITATGFEDRLIKSISATVEDNTDLIFTIELGNFFEGLNVQIPDGNNCIMFRDENLQGFTQSERDVDDTSFSVVSDPVNGDLVVVDGIAIFQGNSLLYDFRFLPIIYNRKKHHLSVNILIPN